MSWTRNTGVPAPAGFSHHIANRPRACDTYNGSHVRNDNFHSSRSGVVVDFEVIKRLLAGLEREQVRYAIFGAVALNLHGLARFTEDLDLFVEPEAKNIERLRAALRTVVDDPEIENITAEDLLGDYPAVQYVPPDGSFQVDILTRLGTAFSFADLEIERVSIDGLVVSVVTPRTLYNMKKDTVRLKDRADAQMLKERFSLTDDEGR